MKIQITPYVSFGALMFNKTTKDECVLLLGEPLNKRTNRKGAEEYEYQQFIVRFNTATPTVRECTLLPYTNASIDEITVTWDKTFLRQACEKDSSPRDVYGFIVFNRLGIAVTGIHDDDESQLAITAFSKGEFDDLLLKSSPYLVPRG
jgi:hypothetical protein